MAVSSTLIPRFIDFDLLQAGGGRNRSPQALKMLDFADESSSTPLLLNPAICAKSFVTREGGVQREK
jgi:hypothetical protein